MNAMVFMLMSFECELDGNNSAKQQQQTAAAAAAAMAQKINKFCAAAEFVV